MIQVYELVDSPQSKEPLEDQVNRWLQANKDVEIIDIKYAMASVENETVSSTVTSALIIYEKEE